MEPNAVFCPGCQQQVVPVPSASGPGCPRCGAGLPEAVPAAVPSAGTSRGKTTFWVLLAALVAPGVLSVLAISGGMDEAGIVFTLLGSGVAALFGAVWLAARVNLHIGVRIALGVVLVPVFYAAALAVCFAGCALQEPQLNFR